MNCPYKFLVPAAYSGTPSLSARSLTPIPWPPPLSARGKG